MIGIYDINSFPEIPFKQRLEIYKSAGFGEIALYIDKNYNAPNENYVDIINYARNIGLEVKQAHIDYKISNLISDNSTNEYFDYVSQKLQEALSLKIPYIVAHASMTSTPPEVNQTALEKFKNMMESFKSKEVTLCLENVRNNNNLKKILNLNLDNVKMCFDVGHAHCYGDEKKLFDEFKNKIICSHLHNNFGQDSHNILTNGEIDYVYFLNNLTQIKYSSNCLECFPKRGLNLNKKEFTRFIADCYNSVKEYII